MKKVIVLFALFSLLTVLVVACGGSSTGGGGSTVHMTDQNFAQQSITINKGSSITVIDDTATPHILANGSWVNGVAQSMQESGAPGVNNMQFNGNDSQTIGPFNTTGTYHFYCTVHTNMNLTVVVQ